MQHNDLNHRDQLAGMQELRDRFARLSQVHENIHERDRYRRARDAMGVAIKAYIGCDSALHRPMKAVGDVYAEHAA